MSEKKQVSIPTIDLKNKIFIDAYNALSTIINIEVEAEYSVWSYRLGKINKDMLTPAQEYDGDR